MVFWYCGLLLGWYLVPACLISTSINLRIKPIYKSLQNPLYIQTITTTKPQLHITIIPLKKPLNHTSTKPKLQKTNPHYPTFLLASTFFPAYAVAASLTQRPFSQASIRAWTRSLLQGPFPFTTVQNSSQSISPKS